MEADELLKKRFRELAQKCWQKNQYTYTGFLSPSELACFYEIERELSYVAGSAWGGSALCERVMVRFGSEEELGYREEFPIACIRVRPLVEKFSDDLTHRDFLGALMNLGIERSTMGDILIKGNTACLFCVENMADFIMENISKVKHTSVLCERIAEPPDWTQDDGQEVKIQIASGRIDAAVSRVYRLSRSEAITLFGQKKVFLNGRQCENNSQMLKDGDTVSVRGYGKFVYLGAQSESKKGKINVVVLCYGKR